MRRKYRNNHGFTMAEMLITVAIIVILCAFGFVAVIAHQRNLKRMEMDETAQEIFIAAQNHLTAARASGQWSSFLKETKSDAGKASRGTKPGYTPSDYQATSDANAASRDFYAISNDEVKKEAGTGKGAMELILPEGSIDETLRGNHFYVEYDAASGTVYGVFYTDSDHAITAEDAQKVSRTEPNARRDYEVDGKRTIIGYYGGALGELKNPKDLYAPAVAVRNAESLVLYVVDKNYNRPVSSETGAANFQTELHLTIEGETSGQKVEKTVDSNGNVYNGDQISEGQPDENFSLAVLAGDSKKDFSVEVPDGADGSKTKSVKAKYYALVLDSIVRENGHFADLFPGLIHGEDLKITVTLHSNVGGEDVSETVRVNSLFNSVKTEKKFFGLVDDTDTTVVTVSNPRHLENLSSEVSGVDFRNKQIKKNVTVDSVSIVRDLFWDTDSAAANADSTQQSDKEKVTPFLEAIDTAKGMESLYGYCAGGRTSIDKNSVQVYPYTGASAGEGSGTAGSTGTDRTTERISVGACYGITNPAIRRVEGNNHILAAFRFEGKEQSALINEGADGMEIRNLLIADATSAVTGERKAAQGTGSSDIVPVAAILIANAKSGSIENIAVRWYEASGTDAANQEVKISGSRPELAAGLQGCRIYSANGIASALIGTVDAVKADGTKESFIIKNATVKTVAASTEKDTAHLGVEGETAAALIGEVRGGTVTLDNSKESDEKKKSTVTVEGTLALAADRGQEVNQAAGGLVGFVSNGKAVHLEEVNLTAKELTVSSEKSAGGLVGEYASGTSDSTLTVEKVNLSANALDVTGKKAAGGAIGNASAGAVTLKEINVLTTKAAGDNGEAGQTATGTEKVYGIRITAEHGTAGGLVGTAESGVSNLTIESCAVSGSGTADQIEAGSSAGGLIGDTQATTTSITGSMASMYVQSEGNGGNPSGTSSTDGAGGLIGSASGSVTINESYSGGRTQKADDLDKKAGDASDERARYMDSTTGQGRYNVYLVKGNGAAGGLIGKYSTDAKGGQLSITNSYSTSSVAVRFASSESATGGAVAGGLVGSADNLAANNTYCTGRVYANKGASGGGQQADNSTPRYGTYAGYLGSLAGATNYYLKGMKGAPMGAVGTLGSDVNPTIVDSQLTGADYYDNNCPLKSGVSESQKTYTFDNSLTGQPYPYRTVNTSIAKPLYDPATGEKVENADQDDTKYAQIGDWEIPEEETTEGTYGLIYYEKIYDKSTGTSEPTFYYHGYVRTSGDSAEDALYTEIKQTKLPGNHSYTTNGFVTDNETYVAEDGYLLLVGKDADISKLTLAFGQSNQSISNLNNNGVRLSDFASEEYPLQKENVSELTGYKAYVVNQKGNNWNQNQFFCAWGGANNQYGGAIVIWETTKIKHEYYTEEKQYGKADAAFTYLPFFADTIEKADGGQLQNVGVQQDNNKTVFGIRSARQLRNFIEAENSKDGWQNYLGSASNCIIEQQLDITLNPNKVKFTYKSVQQDQNSGFYTVPTLSKMSTGVLRSHLRIDHEDNQDFYVLDGLRGTFATNLIGGKVCDLKIKDMKAPFFAEKIENEATVDNVTILNSVFAKGDNYEQETTGGFVSQSSYGNSVSVSNCTIKDSVIHGNGLAGTVSVGTWENCAVLNSQVYGNGFAGTFEWNVTKVASCNVKDSTVSKNGFVGTINSGAGNVEKCGVYHSQITQNGFAETIDQAKKISQCELVDNRIGADGFASKMIHTPTIEKCTILNTIIGGNGFATESNASINSCKIINARIEKNGFIEKNGGVIRTSAVYADQGKYSKDRNKENYTEYFTPYAKDDNAKGYQFLVIGVAPDGTITNENIAGFVLGDAGWHSVISESFVAGTIYGKNVAGFIGNVGDSQNSSVKTSYANVIIHATGKATGFAFTAGNQTEISLCHALGTIESKGNAYGMFESAADGANINGNYSAFWSISAAKWYPFYQSVSTNSGNETKLSQDYYLSDCEINADDSELVDYGQKVKALSHQQLCDLSIDSLQKGATEKNTTGYYQYMSNDNKAYPYPMPANQVAYGDWSHQEPSSYTLLYYEKIGNQYYFHGYSTTDGEAYTEVGNGLPEGKGVTVDEDGYLLVIEKNSTWATFGRADNSGAVSSTNNLTGSLFEENTSELKNSAINALRGKGVKISDDDKAYCFSLEDYLKYADTNKNFASWQTLTQESSGVGVALYSTKGSVPMAKFSFQPFFADTVRKPNVNTSTTPSTITFQSTRNSGDYDYRVRSLRQLKALSDWDGKRFNNLADKSNFDEKFDKDKSSRFSYLSTSNGQCEKHLKIRQDLDINVAGAEINFDYLDGQYFGRTYKDSSNADIAVSLIGLQYDFVDYVSSTGKINSLVIDNASLQGSASTNVDVSNESDISHGNQREFVEYNYGVISEITVQNSQLGSAGLVYQNGDVTKDALRKVRNYPQEGENRKSDKWIDNTVGSACGYLIKITYEKNDTIQNGVIERCVVQNSKVQGAGLVWRNKGGRISDSTVKNCDQQIGRSGLVEYNQATLIQAPAWSEEYEYWYNLWSWSSNRSNKVPDEIIKEHNLPTVGSESVDKVSVSVDAIVENCQVIDCTVTTNGFVGENSVNTQGSTGGSQGSSGVARIQNCQVYGTTSYGDLVVGVLGGTTGEVSKAAGFAGINGKGAEITDCSVTGNVQGLSEAAGFVRSNAGTISGSYANTNVSVEADTGVSFAGFALTNSGTIEKSHSLGTLTKKGRAGDNQRASGFVIRNADGDNSGAINNSYAAVWSIDVKGTGKNYLPFGSDEGTYENCYAMKLSKDDGYGGSYSGTAPTGVNYVSGAELEKMGSKDTALGSHVADEKSAPYDSALGDYPFPCSSDIMNYGDWKLTDAAETARTVTLDAGNRAAFSEELALSLSKDAGMMTASDESTDGTTTKTDGESSSMVSIPEEDRQKVQVELGEEEETLDLSQLVPERKGWKLLGWLITAPSELTASTEKTTVSDIVTKVTKVSDGSAEAEDADAQNTENAAAGAGDSEETEVPKAIYQLETGTKSYHYAPDAVITVTEDMTLSAVWVPDDDTIEKAKDGTLRMDENGNILDGEEQVTNDVTNETTETDSDVSAADTSSVVTGDDTDGMTSENQDASTDQTADASGTLPAQNTEDDMSEMSDLTAESDPEMETSPETTGEEGDPAGE